MKHFLRKLRTPFYIFSYEFCKIVYTAVSVTAQKMKFSIKDFTFTEEILNRKLHFLCSVSSEYSPEVHAESSQIFKRKSFVEIINS